MADEGRAPTTRRCGERRGGCPFLLGDSGAAIAGAIADLLNPAGLLLLSDSLILVIMFMSSDRGTSLSDIFSSRGADSIHRASGFLVGIVLLLLVLLYHRVSPFDGDYDSDH